MFMVVLMIHLNKTLVYFNVFSTTILHFLVCLHSIVSQYVSVPLLGKSVYKIKVI